MSHTFADRKLYLGVDSFPTRINIKSANEECPICRVVFPSHLLPEHIQKHKECPEAFEPNPIEGQSHFNFPGLFGADKNRRCPICLKAVIYAHNLKMHIYKHIDKAVRYQCPRCPKTFAEVVYTRKHIVKVHHEESMKVRQMEIEPVFSSNSFEEGGVEKVIDVKEKLKENVKDKVKEVRYHCPRCPKTFANVALARNHLLSQHKVKYESLEIKLVGSADLYEASINDIDKLD